MSPAPETPSPTASAPGSAAEDTKSAGQIAADVEMALASVQSVHVSGSSTDDKGSGTFELDETSDTARQVTMQSNGSETIIVVGGRAYGAIGRGRFSELPADTSIQLQSLTLSSTVSCLRREHGTYSKGAISTVNGRRVIEIDDDGRAPGAVPSSLFVALDGSPLLIRLTVTGRVTPGGAHECGHPLDATVQSATNDFDYTRSIAPITAPPLG